MLWNFVFIWWDNWHYNLIFITRNIIHNIPLCLFTAAQKQEHQAPVRSSATPPPPIPPPPVYGYNSYDNQGHMTVLYLGMLSDFPLPTYVVFFINFPCKTCYDALLCYIYQYCVVFTLISSFFVFFTEKLSRVLVWDESVVIFFTAALEILLCSLFSYCKPLIVFGRQIWHILWEEAIFILKAYT